MVDLGFLLITFFVFTTSLTRPKGLNLVEPMDGPPIDVGFSSVLTVIPSGGEKLFYYFGEITEALAKGAWGFTSYSETEGIGKIIREKQADMERKKAGSRKDLMLLIKPVETTRLQYIVNMLDEAFINGVTRYTILDVSASEMDLIRSKNIQLH